VVQSVSLRLYCLLAERGTCIKSYTFGHVLPDISPSLTLETLCKPCFVVEEGSVPSEELAKLQDDMVMFSPGKPPQNYVELIANGLNRATEAMCSGYSDLVVLDEIVVALHFGLITGDERHKNRRMI